MEISIVFYLDARTLGCSLMNLRPPNLAEVILWAGEYIRNWTIASTCLITSDNNPTDAFTKQRLNQKLLFTQSLITVTKSSRRVLFLQTSKVLHLKPYALFDCTNAWKTILGQLSQSTFSSSSPQQAIAPHAQPHLWNYYFHILSKKKLLHIH